MYSFAQTFYIDKAAVKSAPSVLLTSVKLYFKRKPKATNNRSGIVNPGVVIGISETDSSYSPDSARIIKGTTVRLSYDQVNALADASVASVFTFDAPVSVASDRFYAIAIKFEDPDFELWQNVQGDRLVNTNTPSPGASGTSDGKFYQFNNYSAPLAMNNVDLKYKVSIAKFAANTVTIDLIPKSQEFIKYSTMTSPMLSGEYVYQDFGGHANGALGANVTFYATGTINVASNSTIVTGSATVGFITNGLAVGDFIVITDGTAGNTDVVQVDQIISNTSINIATKPSFTANGVYYKKTVVAKYFTTDKPSDEVIFTDSTANATAYFTNTSIQTAAITNGGTGYANGDTLEVSGGGSTSNAYATITTDGSGVINRLNFTNVGLGFTTTPTTTITTVGGASATFTYTIGSLIRGRSSQSRLKLQQVNNRKTKFIKPKVGISLPPSAKATYTMNFSNTAYNLDNNREVRGENDKIKELNYDAVIASRSNEVLNGTNLFSDANSKKRSGKIRVKIDMADSGNSSVSSFSSPLIFDNKLELLTMRADINNDVTGEEGRYGNAACKHITKRITFGEGKAAEDLKVFINAYRPPNTDIKIYAKVHNSSDPEPFDDKGWSLLEVEYGVDQVSNQNTPTDMREYGYGLSSYPTLDAVLTGTFQTQGNTQVVGVGSLANTELVANDLVRIYDPLFPENYEIAVVANTTNTTVFDITTNLVNLNVNNISGLKVDKVKHKYSVFNNTSGDNVARYYSTTMVPYDKFDSYSLKVVLLSSDGIAVPRVDDIRSLGVSA
jgi:hypothetical protein